MVGLMVGWAGCSTTAEAGEPERPGMAVSVVEAHRQCLQNVLSVSGFVSPVSRADVRATRDGMVIGGVFVGPGDVVVADQVIARLNVPQPSPSGEPAEGTVVRSPINGMVTAVSAPIGAYASASARDPLFTIVDPDRLEVRTEVLASKLVLLKAGLSARMHVIGLGDLDGRVARVASSVDAMSQAGSVAIALSDRRLRVGAFARADIDLGPVCALTLPLSALQADEQKLAVYVVRADRIETRAVTLLLLDGGRAAVSGDLVAGDRIVAQAAAFLRPGDPVRAIPASEELK